MAMNLKRMITLLNEDLGREYSHWHFYIQSAPNVQGLHREEISEFLLKEAAGEMKHIEEFKRLVVGLGGMPATSPATFKGHLTDPQEILEEALRMEDEVVEQYVLRIEDANELYVVDKVNGKWIELFLEEQILDSRMDADNIREMIKHG